MLLAPIRLMLEVVFYIDAESHPLMCVLQVERLTATGGFSVKLFDSAKLM